MTPSERQEIINSIMRRADLFSLRRDRVARLIKDPLRSIPLYLINILSKIYPFKINYRTFWGDKLNFYLPEGYAILYYGFFEPNLTNFFLRFIQKGDVFFDVGAHIGYYSCLASHLVEKDGLVHSFEPTPRTFDSLRKNTVDKHNIHINNLAVMNKDTEIEFSDYGPKYSAFNSFKNRVGASVAFLKKPKIIKVKTISLDKYRAEKSTSPTIIKIDAEGAEYIILGAMEGILQQDRPVITIEVAGGDEWSDNQAKSIQFLLDHDYVSFEISTDGYLLPRKNHSAYEYDNLVFIPREKMDRTKTLLK